MTHNFHCIVLSFEAMPCLCCFLCVTHKFQQQHPQSIHEWQLSNQPSDNNSTGTPTQSTHTTQLQNKAILNCSLLVTGHDKMTTTARKPDSSPVGHSLHMHYKHALQLAVDSITIPGRINAACKKGEDFDAHINTICNDTSKFYGMKIVTHAPAQRPTRRSARRRSCTVDDQTDVITFCALTRRRIVSALWQVFLQKRLEVRDGKDNVLAMWTRDHVTRYT